MFIEDLLVKTNLLCPDFIPLPGNSRSLQSRAGEQAFEPKVNYFWTQRRRQESSRRRWNNQKDLRRYQKTSKESPARKGNPTQPLQQLVRMCSFVDPMLIGSSCQTYGEVQGNTAGAYSGAYQLLQHCRYESELSFERIDGFHHPWRASRRRSSKRGSSSRRWRYRSTGRDRRHPGE